jgi:peptide/nickel transport system substrate-binding protein
VRKAVAYAIPYEDILGPAKYETQVKSFIQTAFDDVPRIPLIQDYRDVAMQPSIEGYTYWFHLTLDYRTLSRAQ